MIEFFSSLEVKSLIIDQYYIILVLLAVFGAIFGSFFDMLTYRLPNNLSIIKPGSFCPVCKKQLKWYNNIPIFSYIFQGGKCSFCKTHIPARYLLLELITPLLLVSVFQMYLYSDVMTLGDFLRLEFFMLMSIPIFVIDAKYKLIPISLTIIGAIASLLLSPLSAINQFQFSLIGLVVSALVIFIIRFIANKAYNKEAMGEGDIWLMGMIGATTGWFGLPLILLISSLTGIIVGIFYIKIFKSNEIPFGPFLLIGGWSYIVIDFLFGKMFLLDLFSKFSLF